MTSATRPALYPIRWTYAESDPALMLWTAALTRWGMQLPQDAVVLELGCAETDFLERLQRFNPHYDVTGVDVFPQPLARTYAGDGCDPDLFAPNTFDAIMLLGALEHFGLGFYGDPIHNGADGDCNGDVRAMRNVSRWLKPGGWTYFDVPCNQTGCIKENRHFRVYSPGEVFPRLLEFTRLIERHRAYSDCEPHAGTWIPEPTADKVPYHFVAVVAEKPYAVE